MIKHLLLITLLFLQPLTAEESPYPHPDAATTVVASIATANPEHTTYTFEYESEKIHLTGVATTNNRKQSIVISGSYETHQSIESEVQLAFHIYSPKKKLQLVDGKRTIFEPSEKGRTANFHYDYSYDKLNISKKDKSFFLKFNYVKEHHYWINQMDPRIELPSVKITQLDRGEQLAPIISFYPTLILQAAETKSFHLYYSYPKGIPKTDQESPQAENTNRQAFPKRSKRFSYKLNNFRVDKTGLIKIATPNANYGKSGQTKRAYAVTPISYFLLATVGILSSHLFFSVATSLKNRRIKIPALALCSIGTGMLAMQFLNIFFPPIALCLSSLLLANRRIKSKFRTYWILVIFICTNEVIWTHTIPNYPSNITNNIFSIAIFCLLLSPITLIKSPKARTTIGLTSCLTVGFFYISMSLYHQFFLDYPTLTTLKYASQGIEIADSIFTLLDFRYYIFAVAIITSASLLVIWELRDARSSALEAKVS